MILLKLNGGLQKPINSRVMTTILRPPSHYPSKRALTPHTQRENARQRIGTSKDVMPAKAGYTSTLFRLRVLKRKISAGYDFDALIQNTEIWRAAR